MNSLRNVCWVVVVGTVNSVGVVTVGALIEEERDDEVATTTRKCVIDKRNY
jgi:hypothetical protein